jgi:regulator of sigma E protease
MPADRAGISDGDRMIAIDGRQLARWDDVKPQVQSANDRAIDVELERAGRKLHLSVTPVDGKIGVTPRPGLIPLHRAVVDALTFPVRAVTAAASGFWHAIVGDESVEMAGPVGVVRATGASASSLLFLFALTLSMALPIVFVVDGVSFLVLALVMRDRW